MSGLEVCQFESRLVAASLAYFRSLVKNVRVTRMRVDVHFFSGAKLTVTPSWLVGVCCTDYSPIYMGFWVQTVLPYKGGECCGIFIFLVPKAVFVCIVSLFKVV